jgi:hypothetical protein
LHKESTFVIRLNIYLEKTFEAEVPVFEVRVVHFELKTYEHIVVLVVREAEALPFEHFAVAHVAIADKDLASLSVNILIGSNLKRIFFRYFLHGNLPNFPCFFLLSLVPPGAVNHQSPNEWTFSFSCGW